MSLDASDIFLAYRSAKSDLQSSGQRRRFDLLDYEQHLEQNLRALGELISAEDETWVREPVFVGGYRLVPKRLESDRRSSSSGVVRSDAFGRWQAIVRESAEPPLASFRIGSTCSIQMHVLAALWISQVGHLFDEGLSDSAMGNRVRRTRSGSFNRHSTGSFKDYYGPYRSWQQGGLDAMSDALDRGESVIAVTADVTAFYSRLSIDFLLDSDFIETVAGLELTPEQEKLHRLFCGALAEWSRRVGGELGIEVAGLPVGMPASGLIANLALIQFDRIAEELGAHYYARYVDDILIVIPYDESIDSIEAFWRSISADSPERFVLNSAGLEYVAPYLSGSRIVFENEKNKLFLLEPRSGRATIESISRSLRERASEWRELPLVDLDHSRVLSDIVSATEKSGGGKAQSLRAADEVSAKRAGFAMRLRDTEALEEDLNPEVWSEIRREFLDAFITHVLAPVEFFELARYLGRVLEVATACGESERLALIIEAVERIFSEVRSSCDVRIAGREQQEIDQDVVSRAWGREIQSVLEESVVASMGIAYTRENADALVDLLQSTSWNVERPDKIWGDHMHSTYRALFARDLARVPFVNHILGESLVGARGVPGNGAVVSIDPDTVPQLLADGVAALATLTGSSWLVDESAVAGAVLPTRPLGIPELSLVLNSGSDLGNQLSDSGSEVNRYLLAFRGYRVPQLWDQDLFSFFGHRSPEMEQAHVVRVGMPLDNSRVRKIRVGLTVLDMKQPELEAAVKGNPTLDLERYQRLTEAFNYAISLPRGSLDYVVAPELSVPARWFRRFARKLHGRGVGLIAGIEYLASDSPGGLRNQVWAALPFNVGWSSLEVIYKQDKQIAAVREEEVLRSLGLRLEPKDPFKTGRPPLIDHSGFRFAALICSELTNIDYRAALRGEVDALFVPEWNRDVTSFASFVESAALDIHAFIVQSNKREHGDSRIRAPYRHPWLRDVVRVAGGSRDYLVVGEIDVPALRGYQNQPRSTEGNFKPLPDGFRVSPARDSKQFQ